MSSFIPFLIGILDWSKEEASEPHLLSAQHLTRPIIITSWIRQELAAGQPVGASLGQELYLQCVHSCVYQTEEKLWRSLLYFPDSIFVCVFKEMLIRFSHDA